MKKTGIILTSMCTLLLFGGCSKPQANPPASSTSEASSASVASESKEVPTKATSEFLPISQVSTLYEEKHPNTTITSIELDDNLGTYFYEVKGVDNDKEYEVFIEASSGAVKRDRDERLDVDERNGQKAKEDGLGSLKGVLEPAKVAELAEKEVGGGQAREWKLEKELNVLYWEVKVKDGQQEHEVKVDALKGTVLANETDD